MLGNYLQKKLYTCLVELYPTLSQAQLNRLTHIERSNPKHADYASNAAMILAGILRQKPVDIATDIAGTIKPDQLLEKVSVAPPGFINFHLRDSAIAEQCGNIPGNENYGCSEYGKGKRVLLEYVSANPTGPLHIGHGRGAAFGDIMARLLRTCGYDVDTEYYINDAGRQTDILGACIWLRYLQQSGYPGCGDYPGKGYQGDYINDIATRMHAEHAQAAWPDNDSWPSQDPDGEDYLDALIAMAKKQPYHDSFCDHGLGVIAEDIKADLQAFSAAPQGWFSEKKLLAEGDVARALKILHDRGHTEQRDGATWFCASRFGDDKDRVLVRETGQETYFLSDIAYHLNKYYRGYDLILNIWGADHHGYAPRIKAAMTACGENHEKLEIILLQFVSLRNAGQQVAMSTRAGKYVTLRQLRTIAGHDAARFFYVMRKGQQHLDFDLQLAQSQTTDNPVYYLQYAHARICSILHNADKLAPDWKGADRSLLAELHLPTERELMLELLAFPELIHEAAHRREPHRLTFCLRDIATMFHSYYNETTVLHEDHKLRAARLLLVQAVQAVLRRGMALLAVTAPEQM